MRKKVLIVDDSTTVRKALETTLTDAGYAVTEADNGQNALELAGHSQFDLLITDLNMPKMDGMDFVREFRKLEGCRFTPAIMLTTESNTLKKIESFEIGVSGWLNKPFQPEQVMRILRIVAPPE
jgi:two-component system chemotaxis response regulator CheY